MVKCKSYISVLFRCCRAYARIYLNSPGTAYAGHCPKCCRKLELFLAPDGVEDRIFEAE